MRRNHEAQSGSKTTILEVARCVFCLQAGLVHAGEAIASIPNMLTAICLNTEGLALVKDSNALDCLVPVLTTPSYIKALNVSATAHVFTLKCACSTFLCANGHLSDLEFLGK